MQLAPPFPLSKSLKWVNQISRFLLVFLAIFMTKLQVADEQVAPNFQDMFRDHIRNFFITEVFSRNLLLASGSVGRAMWTECCTGARLPSFSPPHFEKGGPENREIFFWSFSPQFFLVYLGIILRCFC